MNIISVDLPWNPDKRGRTALAVADLGGNIKIMQANDDNEMLGLVRDNAEPESLVLLDVPIDGCDNLGSQHFRPVDKALRHAIPILPTSKAKDRGKRLEELIRSINQGKRIIVQEIYPYAVYKFLVYLKDKKLLPSLKANKFGFLLDDGFRTFPLPKYKREKRRDERLENMGCLHSLLTDSSLGLRFSTPLGYPDNSYSWAKLNRLCDEYDACLGAIVGIYFANNSSYACLAGDSNSGNMLLLADRWLFERLNREVRVYKPEGGS